MFSKMITALAKPLTGLAVRLCSLKCCYAFGLAFLTALIKKKKHH